MKTKRSWGLLGQALFALSCVLVLAASGVAGASVVRTPAKLISIPSVGQMVFTRQNVWSLGGGVAYSDGNVPEYSASLYRLHLSGGGLHRRNKVCRGCAWRGNNMATAVALSSRPATADLTSFTMLSDSPVDTLIVPRSDVSDVLVAEKVDALRLAGTGIAGLEGALIWRANSFSIAGSRVWSKIIKFSSSGINVRVPLN